MRSIVWMVTLAFAVVGCAGAPASADPADPAPAEDGGVELADAGVGGSPDGGGATGPDLDAGPAITAPRNTWTWVDVPGSACDDGSPTGLAVNLTDSPNVLVFMNGGGACWDATSCLVLNVAVHGPIGRTQFEVFRATFADSVLDRSLAGSPFAGWNLVWIPYCTGDLHGGQNVATYTRLTGEPRAYHHVGHLNVLADLRRLAPTFANARKVVLAGSSAGGFGAMLNQPAFHAAFPASTLMVLDDSGPMIEGFRPEAVAGFFANWRLDLLVDPVCGPGCRTDLSLMHSGLAALGDRTALLSSTRDATMRTYAGLSAPEFEAALRSLERERVRPSPGDRVFFVDGTTHTMLHHPARFSQDGVSLLPWLTWLVDADPAWASVIPRE